MLTVLLRLALVLFAVAVALGAAEVVVRRDPGLLSIEGHEVDAQAIATYRAWKCDGEVAGFRPHPYFQVTRTPGSYETNSLGFHGEEWPLERTEGVLRVVCMGGSTTEGGNPDGIPGSYPDRLRETLEYELGREVEVFNAGVSGWTSAESVLCWFLLMQDYQPDLVILHNVVNDVEPRFFAGFRSDYSHARRAATVQPAAWPLRSLLRVSDLCAAFGAREEPPTLGSLLERPDRVDAHGLSEGPAGAYERNVRSLVHGIRESGATVMLMTMPTRATDPPEQNNVNWREGVRQHNALLREVAADEGLLLADAEIGFASDPERVSGWFLDLVHVSAEGNAAKAAVAYVTLRDSGWLGFLALSRPR